MSLYEALQNLTISDDSDSTKALRNLKGKVKVLNSSRKVYNGHMNEIKLDKKQKYEMQNQNFQTTNKDLNKTLTEKSIRDMTQAATQRSRKLQLAKRETKIKKLKKK